MCVAATGVDPGIGGLMCAGSIYTTSAHKPCIGAVLSMEGYVENRTETEAKPIPETETNRNEPRLYCMFGVLPPQHSLKGSFEH